MQAELLRIFFAHTEGISGLKYKVNKVLTRRFALFYVMQFLGTGRGGIIKDKTSLKESQGNLGSITMFIINRWWS